MNLLKNKINIFTFMNLKYIFIKQKNIFFYIKDNIILLIKKNIIKNDEIIIIISITGIFKKNRWKRYIL